MAGSLVKEIKDGQRIYIVGNGGSFANASHIVNDLLSCGIKAFDINQPFFSATANDLGYEKTFSRWLEVIGEPGDLLVALSGSGKSPNILRAIETAEKIGMRVYKVFGAEQGLNMQETENVQLEIGHEVMWCLRNS